MSESGDGAGEQAPAMPAEVDLDRPSAARIYDWMVGGCTNFAVDREFGKRQVEQFPLIRPALLANRRWVGRVVRAALDAGITQFLDLGAGIPTAGAPHQIIRDMLGHDAGRVVYVDYEPVAAAHATLTLQQDEVEGWVATIRADYRTPSAVLEHPETARLLDFTRPVAVLLASVLQFVGPGEDIPGMLAAYRSVLAPGSWMAVSHPAVDDADPELATQAMPVADDYGRNSQNPLWVRDRQEIASWFDGLSMVPPGLVHAEQWRPEQGGPAAYEAQASTLYWMGAGEVPG